MVKKKMFENALMVSSILLSLASISFSALSLYQGRQLDREIEVRRNPKKDNPLWSLGLESGWSVPDYNNTNIRSTNTDTQFERILKDQGFSENAIKVILGAAQSREGER